jgi:hypothetical protein
MGIRQRIGGAAIGLADTAVQASGGVVDTLASILTSIPKALSEGVGRMIEAVGNGLAAGLDAAASRLGDAAPGAGLARWLGGGLSTGLQAVAMIARAIGYALSDIVAGLIRILGGLLTLKMPLVVKGLGDIAAGLAGAVVAIAGALAGFVQTLVRAQAPGRPLTGDEAAQIASVYRGSLDIRPIRIIAGKAGLFTILQPQYPGAPARQFALGNRIYMQDTPASEWIDVLVHECGHVWQNQHDGTRYLAEALWAQNTYQWVERNAYDWLEEKSKGRARWQDFNREAQAEFIQTVWKEGRRTGPAPGGAGDFFQDEQPAGDAIFRSPELTAFAKESIAFVRGTPLTRPAG